MMDPEESFRYHLMPCVMRSSHSNGHGCLSAGRAGRIYARGMDEWWWDTEQYEMGGMREFAVIFVSESLLMTARIRLWIGFAMHTHRKIV